MAHQLPAEEAHHVFGPELERAVLEQPGHQLLEVRALAEEDIGRILGLRRHPIVLHRSQQLAEEWIGAPGIAPEHPDPVDAWELIGDLLPALDIAQAQESVVELEVLDSSSVELARQPLVTVEVDLPLEREPALQLDVDESQLAIPEVVVELQALTTRLRDIVRSSCQVKMRERSSSLRNGRWALWAFFAGRPKRWLYGRRSSRRRRPHRTEKSRSVC